MTKQASGFVVVEASEDFEQILTLEVGPHFPPGGILSWPAKTGALFATRKAARAAINRTEHYRLAFGANYPERKLCRVRPLARVSE